MPRYQLRKLTCRTSAAERITGMPAQEQREARRADRLEPSGKAWSEYDPHTLARLLFVQALRDADVKPSIAWEMADEEIVGAILVQAGMVPGTIQDKTGDDVFEKNPSYRTKLAFELAGRKTVGGPIFAFGSTVQAGAYGDLEHVVQEAKRRSPGPHVITHVSLRELGEILADRAGPLAVLEKVER